MSISILVSPIIMNQKGVSLYLAIVIMIILLAIVLSVATILVGQLKIIREMENSVIAFYAADTGIEEVLKIIINDGQEPDPRYPPGTGQTSVGDASYYVQVFSSGEADCTATLYCLKSVGTYKGTRRAIEVEI
jgi:hypothetical protein